MSSTTTNKNLVNSLRVSAGFFILSALFDVLSQFVPSYALFIIWLIVMYAALLVFIWLCHIVGELRKDAESNTTGAMGTIVIMIIADIILWVGLINFWPLVYGVFGIILYFLIDILRGIGFTLAYLGLKKVDKSMNNPTYLIYGWGGLLFEILYWITDFDTGYLILEIEFYVMLILLLAVAVTQFFKANQAANLSITAQPAVLTGYSSFQPYQQPQTYQPAQSQAPAPASQANKFCENCGAKLEADAKFCTNCGSNA
ncbi:MAG: zinc ribbon domain-containing protein [Candidatus Heimdallarchaeota archaeon]|nr:zinc ribbon domain-containing protein [Candidatus Heimdallarchaeota archaeon]